MAKEVAISKKLKISQAQQYMLLAVFGASIFLGVAISLVSTFIHQISFNTKVIMAEEESILHAFIPMPLSINIIPGAFTALTTLNCKHQ